MGAQMSKLLVTLIKYRNQQIIVNISKLQGHKNITFEHPIL